MNSSIGFFCAGEKIKENQPTNCNKYDMTIELQFNSVVLDLQVLQKYYPELFSAIHSSLPVKKKYRRRKRKKKKTVACLIDEILENL